MQTRFSEKNNYQAPYYNILAYKDDKKNKKNYQVDIIYFILYFR